MLGLLALFTHIHLFWVAGLLLAMIDIPDFGARSLSRIAGSTEKLAGLEPGQGAVDAPSQTIVEDKGDDGATTVPVEGAGKEKERSSKEKEVVHA